MNDQRRTARKRTLLGGRLLLGGRSAIDCTVRDLSATGAKLLFAAPTLLPSEFKLEIPSTSQRFDARLIWLKGASCGVQFTAG